jgi:carboxylesterase 2
VTIFGESAGGYSVKQLLAVPPSPRPYRGAILESEAASFTENGLTSWESLVALLNCTTATSQITCVQSKPATTIKNEIEMNMLDFAPAYDNVTAVQDVRQSIITKEFADVPFFLGTNANEGRVLATAAGIGANTSQDLIEPFLNVTFPGNVSLQNAILAAYPNSLTKNAYEFISQILTDETFLCPSAALADLAVMNGYDVWRYYFNATFPNTQSFPDAGVYHSSEIPEVFGTYPTINETTQEVKLSQYIQRAWANFAKNPSNGPGWPRLGTNLGVELGDLGGDCIDGEKTIQRSTVDAICAVYAPVIAAMPL